MTRSPRQRFAIVMPMAVMLPEALSGYKRHRKRRGAEKDEVGARRSHLNRRPVGDEDWAFRAGKVIEAMALFDFQQKLKELRKRGRRARHDQRLMEGHKEPLHKTRHGPLLEVILTASQESFQRPNDTEGIVDCEQRFE
ncbi:MAG: hypothetical protein CML46_04300 [Rhodobacteraceae bacterium]|nr:hypothetical protein [Paracoccaceae bacterium]MBR26162.1 hypothetical protein [Paracoccaceae bacterium]